MAKNPDPAVEGESPASGFRSFAPEHFQEDAAWRALDRILTTNGGSYGLAGSRGAGKTWHMLNAVEVIRKRRGVGLWYPSPGEYEAVAFLSTLTHTFADEVYRRYRRRPFRPV